MPFIRVNCPKKALSPEQKATLAAAAGAGLDPSGARSAQ
jgi:hypothetical protein